MERPAVVEVELGTPLRDVLASCGAPLPGRRIKAVLSGVSNAVLTEAQLDTPCSYEAFAAAGSGLGAAGFIVYDDTACMVEVAAAMSRFLWVESCGQCPACKLGTGAITDRARRHRRRARHRSRHRDHPSPALVRSPTATAASSLSRSSS